MIWTYFVCFKFKSNFQILIQYSSDLFRWKELRIIPPFNNFMKMISSQLRSNWSYCSLPFGCNWKKRNLVYGNSKTEIGKMKILVAAWLLWIKYSSWIQKKIMANASVIVAKTKKKKKKIQFATFKFAFTPTDRPADQAIWNRLLRCSDFPTVFYWILIINYNFKR